jgi:hypothetical protein
LAAEAFKLPRSAALLYYQQNLLIYPKILVYFWLYGSQFSIGQE